MDFRPQRRFAADKSLSIHDVDIKEHGHYVTRNGQLRNSVSNLNLPIRYIMDLEDTKIEEDLSEISPSRPSVIDMSQSRKSKSPTRRSSSNL